MSNFNILDTAKQRIQAFILMLHGRHIASFFHTLKILKELHHIPNTPLSNGFKTFGINASISILHSRWHNKMK